MNTQSIRNARKQLNAFQVSDTTCATSIGVLTLVAGLSHLLLIVVR